jgi:hypothetical protein
MRQEAPPWRLPAVPPREGLLLGCILVLTTLLFNRGGASGSFRASDGYCPLLLFTDGGSIDGKGWWCGAVAVLKGKGKERKQWVWSWVLEGKPHRAGHAWPCILIGRHRCSGVADGLRWLPALAVDRVDECENWKRRKIQRSTIDGTLLYLPCSASHAIPMHGSCLSESRGDYVYLWLHTCTFQNKTIASSAVLFQNSN